MYKYENVILKIKEKKFYPVLSAIGLQDALEHKRTFLDPDLSFILHAAALVEASAHGLLDSDKKLLRINTAVTLTMHKSCETLTRS